MSTRPTDPRVAVIGCGPWGRNLVRTFSRLGALVAVADVDEVVATAVAGEHGVPVRDAADLVAADDVDAIVVATPARLHAEVALGALLADKHVFVEKPLALTMGDARRLVETAEERGLTLMVGHLLQYHPAFITLRDLIADGQLGALRHLASSRLNLGRVRREENSLWSFAPHDISMILSLVGEEPIDVAAHGASFLSPGVADVTTTHLTFRGGQLAQVHVSWLHPFKEQRLVVVGEDAMAVFDDTLPWSDKLKLYRHHVDVTGPVPTAARAEAVAVEVPESEPLQLECQHFLDRVADGEAPRTDGREGLRVLQVLSLADEALRRTTAAAPPPASDVTVHPSAVVDEGVTLGVGTKVWHFSHLLSDTTVGRDCTIGQNVVIGPHVTVGDRCRVQNNVSLYEGVTLEDGVFCGPSAVFTNVHNPRAEVSRKDEFRSTPVRRGATIGANATIVCGNEIGAYAFIGAGAVVVDDVAAHALVVGNPARPIGWMSHDGERLGEDLVCPRSGRRYEVVDGALRERSEAADPAGR